MPLETAPQSRFPYFLAAFDAKGHERTDDRDGLMSAKIIEALRAQPVTDVFLLSHGWQGDVPGARAQYNNWIDAMAACADDLAAIKRARPAFHPMIIGLHWPSLAWGEEELGGGEGSFAFSSPQTDPLEKMVAEYAQRLDATPEMRDALRVILRAAAQDIAPEELPAEVRDAYRTARFAIVAREQRRRR